MHKCGKFNPIIVNCVRDFLRRRWATFSGLKFNNVDFLTSGHDPHVDDTKVGQWSVSWPRPGDNNVYILLCLTRVTMRSGDS